MAKTKVFSRFPGAMEFCFYPQNGDVIEVSNADRIVINGTTEVLNNALITREGALTLFGFDHHDVEKREYTTEDLERLKEHPVFKRFLENGDVSLGVITDLSRDFTGIGMLSAEELASRAMKDADGNPLSLKASK